MARKKSLQNIQKPEKKEVRETSEIIPISKEQESVIEIINNNIISFIWGPPGSGKTWLAVCYGVKAFLEGKFERLIFTRPCVESCGERLGYLPGDASDKIAPYMLPVFDVLSRRMSRDDINTLIDEGKICTIPLAFQRGLTFANAYVIGDEFQNTIPQQMKLFLTRIGENSKMVITGDLNQSDIRGENGLVDAIKRLKDVEGIGTIGLTSESITRHPIIKIIEQKYST